MMNKLSLYKKTHLLTGLQYLGYTSQDPYTYKGSGKYWSRHLKKHGNNVHTEILFESNNKEEIKNQGIYYSQLWNIVNDPTWANLKEESGSGGAMGEESRKIVSSKMKGRSKSDEWKINHSKIMTGKLHSDKAKINHSKAMSGSKNGMWGRTHSEETKKFLSENTRKHLKGKTYEEIYGPEKAAKLKKLRSATFKKNKENKA